MSLKLGLPNKIRRSRAAGNFVGLLDQPFATGATAAYSLRLLRAKHSGGLVRVRADDAGTSKGEADVLPVLQPDGSKIITLNSPIENFTGTPFSGDGYVLADLVDSGNNNYDGLTSKWYGQTPNKNDATQSGASEQPQIVSSGSVIQENGKPVIDFNGSQFFNVNKISNTVSSYSIYAVFKQSDDSRLADFRDSSGDLILSEQNAYFIGEGYGVELRKFAGEQIAEWHLKNNAEIYQNNVRKNSGLPWSDRSIKNTDYGKIGKSKRFIPDLKGFIKEFIIFDGENLSKRNNIVSNINNVYSIF